MKDEFKFIYVYYLLHNVIVLCVLNLLVYYLKIYLCYSELNIRRKRYLIIGGKLLRPIDPIIECFLNTDVMCLYDKLCLPEKRIYIMVYCYS